MKAISADDCADSKPRLVCLCGCLCAGKTTFAENLLSSGIGTNLLKEDLTEHPIYSELQSGRASWMETQLEFYVRWAQLICSIDARPGITVVVDHSLDVHHEVYSRLAHESKFISDRQWETLCEAYGSFRDFTNSRFLTRNVVLEASPETLALRLRSRKRDLGDGFHYDFLDEHVKRFNSWSTTQGGALILGELDSEYELSDDTELRVRILRFIDVGLEGANWNDDLG